VGIARTRFFPSRTPVLKALVWGGKSSDIP
jgi:hypothetical protein